MRAVDNFQFSDADAEKVRAISSGASELIGGLEAVATQYLHWKACEFPSRSVSRSHLLKVERAARALYDHMLTMDEEAEWQMCLAAAVKDSGHGVNWANSLRDQLAALAAACADASRSLARRPKKRPNADLAWAIEELIKLFEADSGTRFTHTRSDMGEPTSKGGLFIRTFFAAVDPAVTPQAIASHLNTLSRRRTRPRSQEK